MADDDDEADDAVYRVMRQHFASTDQDDDPDAPPFGNFWDFSKGMTWRMLKQYWATPWVDVTLGIEYSIINDGRKEDDTQPMAPPSMVFQESRDGALVPGATLLIMKLNTWYGLPVAFTSVDGKVWWRLVPKPLHRRMVYSTRIQRQMMRDLSLVIKDFEGSRVVSARTCDLTNIDVAKFNLLTLRTRDGTTTELVVRYYADNGPGDGTLTLEPQAEDERMFHDTNRGMDSFSDTTRFNVQHVLDGYRDLMLKTPNFRVTRGPMDAITTADPRMAPHVRAMKTLRDDPFAGEFP